MIRRLKSWIRTRLGRPKLGTTHSVELRCPETDECFATEKTEPVAIERDVEGGTGIYTYECDECGARHRFLWGPPAPIYVGDEDGGDVGAV